ncbi:MAG: helix-hairpin-helix domain-containing protein [Roseburia sp.]
MNHQKVYIGLIIFGMLLLAGCGRRDSIYLETAVTEQGATEQIEIKEAETETDTNGSDSLCYVYVCGAVCNPGVYLLQEGSRVYEAIELAGGLTEEAAKENLNQAETIWDGQMIQVLTEEEATQEITTAGDNAAVSQIGTSSDGKININTATLELLMTLPGVGQSKAESIIAYREENGLFSSVEAIKNVNGIKDGVYNQIKDKITVD